MESRRKVASQPEEVFLKRLPRKVKVGSHTYTIVRKSAKDMPPDQLGDCDFNKLEIQILQKLPPDKLREVALHEIIHTCTYPNLVDKTDIDEAFVEMIAPNLMNVLRENPKFVEFLLDQPAPKPEPTPKTPEGNTCT